MSEILLCEDRGRVRILTLNRPEKRNALDLALICGLLDALRAADADPAIGCIVLTGAGTSFSSGADLSELRVRGADPAFVATRADATKALHLAVSKMGKPVVTALNGAAVGFGAGIAIAADMVVMAESAKFGYPETRHGMAPTMLIPNLVRQVGRKMAFELAALGELIDAKQALALGLVNRVVADGNLMAETLRIAETLAAIEPVAMATTKELFHAAVELSLAEGLEIGSEANEKMRRYRSR